MNKVNVINLIQSILDFEIQDKNDNEIKLLQDYTDKIIDSISLIDSKIDSNSMLNFGDTPECCKSCTNYKEGQVTTCNCILPYKEMITKLAGDYNGLL